MPLRPDLTIRRILPLAVVIVVGAFLRFWGLQWGLPDRLDLHPDEHDYVMNHAIDVSFKHPDPKFINYPSFLCYSTALVHGALKLLNPRRPDWRAWVVGRSIVALYGTLTILAARALARRMGARPLGQLLAAFWVAILPLHVWESHIAVTDVMMTFWVLMTLVMSLRLMQTPKASDYVLTGVCLGLAVGSKYTAALVGVAPLWAMLVSRPPMRTALRGMLIVGAASLFACFIVSPFSFLHFGQLLKALAYENEHVHGHHFGFSLPAHGTQYHRYVYQLVAAWPFSLGVPLYLCAAAGACWAATRIRRETFAVLLFGTIFFGVTGSWTLTPLRYYMPLVVAGAILAGVWQGEWLAASSPRWRFRVALVSVVVTAVYTLAFTISTTRRFQCDTRVQADRWLREHLGPQQTAHLFGWGRYAGIGAGPNLNVRSHREVYLPNIAAFGTNDWIEVSSLHYLRWYRHDNAPFMAVYERLRNSPHEFERLARFDAPFLNRDFYGRLDPMFRCYFISPTIEFYRVRPPS